MNNPVKKQFYDYLKQKSSDELFCVYIDFPFCQTNCKYCIYHSLDYWDDMSRVNSYREAVITQIKEYRKLLSEFRPDRVYFGGGTPNLWGTEYLLKITEIIPDYHNIPMIKSELHPYLLDEAMVKFYIDVMKVDVVSIGVQSFDFESCRKQNRTFDSKEHIKDMVRIFQNNNVKVNLDLVALFAGDEEEDWDIFDRDMEIATKIIIPDVITSVPNYKTKLNYIEQIPRFRKILQKHVSDEYVPISKKMLSLDLNDIIQYGYNDHWIGKPSYWEYESCNKRYSCSGPSDSVPNQITLSFGGAGNHRVYSYLPDRSMIVYSYYDFNDKMIHYQIKNG